MTNADIFSVIPNATHVIQQNPSNKGEIDSQWLDDDIIYCDTVAHVTNIAQVALPSAVSHSHHLIDYPQDGDITVELPDDLSNSMYLILHVSMKLITSKFILIYLNPI